MMTNPGIDDTPAARGRENLLHPTTHVPRP